jgi:hypothetical protein
MSHQNKSSTTSSQVPISRELRNLSLAELGDRILKIQQTAVRQHFPPQVWRQLDRMRIRHAALLKEARR